MKIAEIRNSFHCEKSSSDAIESFLNIDTGSSDICGRSWKTYI